MSLLLEQYLPVVAINGLNTNKAVVFGSTLAVTGATTLTGVITATAGITSPTTLTAVNAGANTSGGNTTPALLMGSSGIGIYFGDGAPTISAVKGSLYLNFTGSSTSTRLYVNNGTTNWVAVTTAS